MGEIEQLKLTLKFIEMKLREYIDELNKRFGNIFDIDEIIGEFSKYTREGGYPEKEIPIVKPVFMESAIDVMYDVDLESLNFS
ncbi:hypothetical protein ACFSMW_10615 [Virgibacillus halophilus]|uniref:Uncharacterized protein n=1 Tax=Tigheibacillus halophilus TaxID=361280 RepID=A0ABU5C6H1_9BACI|nr:hypothetical protein [Virgibacillus halophilus]